VIEYRHDDSPRRRLAPSFSAWIGRVAAEIEDGTLVATEDDGVFFGLLPRASPTGSLASLRVRGEPAGAHDERVDREILGDPLQLAMQVVPRLRRAGRLKLVADAQGPSPLLFGLYQSIAAALAPVREPAGRPPAILAALRTSPAVAAVSATHEDVSRVIAESRR
jgi:hypothetical protein